MPVTFDDASHSYTSHKGERYISVTQLLKLYTPPFDSDYWSSYKALKDVMEAHGLWYYMKKAAGGWESVLQYCRALGDKLPHIEEVIAAKKAYLLQWQDKAETASEKGRKFHASAQDTSMSSRLVTADLQEIPAISGKDLLAAQDFTSNGIYTELLLYSDKFKIAGQADWVMKTGKTVAIKDYKTCEKIPKESFQDQVLLYPLHSLPSSKFFIYTMQLSLYAYLMELSGFTCRKLVLEHVISEKDRIPYEVEYMRQLCIDLVEHYVASQRQIKAISPTIESGRLAVIVPAENGRRPQG